jgi:dUTP pyrophosphatase
MVKKYLGVDNGVEGDGCYDSGFDLICPERVNIIEKLNIMVDHKIVCAMKYKNKFVSYYLYSRSSTPIKTPLRLANSVGIIDSGYRGHIKAYFDVVMNFDLNRNIQFNVNSGARYVQLCPSCIDKPMMVVLVDDISMFGKTNRSDNGFGSSG